MKDLSNFYSVVRAAATVARKSISNPVAARKAIAFEERLAKLAAASGKSAKPRRKRVAAK